MTTIFAPLRKVDAKQRIANRVSRTRGSRLLQKKTPIANPRSVRIAGLHSSVIGIDSVAAASESFCSISRSAC
jgi:hypothetical protein